MAKAQPIQTVITVGLPEGEAYGVTVDGVNYPLQGQPPVATGGAWWPPTHKAG